LLHNPQVRSRPTLGRASPHDSHYRRALADAGYSRDWLKTAESEFRFVPIGGGGNRDAAFYGETVIPKRYLDEVDGFRLLSFRDDLLPQSYVELRRAGLNADDGSRATGP
jgi:hypothetical protein